mmetsp:Transcript_35716/g.79442  ORF Transcript_35716/g.79442 Transcript_35716/m.79442 type:complete len:242 (+) Transcript_35716:181-906(+)
MDLECAICYGLLLDPVVGRCGHDFCLRCLERWCSEQRARSGRPPSCPLCRTPLMDFVDDEANLAVCIRLKNLIEKLCPEKVAARRREVERMSRDAAGSTSSEQAARTAVRAAAAQQLSRSGRARYIRVRRSRPPPLPSTDNSGSNNIATHGQQYPWAGPVIAGAAQHPLQQQFHALLSSSAAAAAAAATYAVLSMPGFPTSTSLAAVNWVAPQVDFTMGWYEPNESRRKPRRSRPGGQRTG